MQLIKKAINLYSQNDEKYNHLDKADIEKVIKCVEEKQKWFEEKSNLINKMNLYEEPTVLASQIKFEKEVLTLFMIIIIIKIIFFNINYLFILKTLDKTSWSILNKPKPKVEPPKPEAQPQPQQQQNAPSPQSANDPAAKKADRMDVD